MPATFKPFFLREHHGDGAGIDTKEWGAREMCVVDPSDNRIYSSEAIA